MQRAPLLGISRNYEGFIYVLSGSISEEQHETPETMKDLSMF